MVRGNKHSDGLQPGRLREILPTDIYSQTPISFCTYNFSGSCVPLCRWTFILTLVTLETVTLAVALPGTLGTSWAVLIWESKVVSDIGSCVGSIMEDEIDSNMEDDIGSNIRLAYSQYSSIQPIPPRYMALPSYRQPNSPHYQSNDFTMVGGCWFYHSRGMLILLW